MNKKTKSSLYWKELVGNLRLVLLFVVYYWNLNRYFDRQNINSIL